MNHIRVSDQAKIDLIEIFAYWEGVASLTVADHIVENIEEHFQLLAQFPDIGRKCPEIAPGAMRFPSEKYLIYYRKGRRVIEILHILHGARDQRSAFRRK